MTAAFSGLAQSVPELLQGILIPRKSKLELSSAFASYPVNPIFLAWLLPLFPVATPQDRLPVPEVHHTQYPCLTPPPLSSPQASGYIQAAATLCANALVKLTGCASTSGANSKACSVTIGSAQASSAVSAMIQAVQYAFANSVGANCASSVDLMANSFVTVDDVVSCCQSSILEVRAVVWL